MSPVRDLLERRQPRPPLLGRIRLGSFERGRPQQSTTFIFTASDRIWLTPLAELYGGTVDQYEPQGQSQPQWRLVSEADAINVLFPFEAPEQNVEQWWELWSRTGLQRRCDGYRASVFGIDPETGEITTEDSECICAADDER